MDGYKKYLIGFGMSLSTLVAPAAGQAVENDVQEQEVQAEEYGSSEEEKLENPIKFHVEQPEETAEESFSMAEKYLEEEIGLDVEFKFYDRELSEDIGLDHIRNFAIRDVTPEEMVDQVQEKAQPPEKNPYIDSEKEFERGMDIARQYYHKEGNVYAETSPRDSTIYLIEHSDDSKEETHNPSQLAAHAKAIIHEIGHLAGLYHPELFPSYHVASGRGKYNIMKPGLPEGDGEHNFILNDRQKEIMRSYFRMGERFELFEENDFQTHHYLNDVARENGYRQKKRTVLDILKGVPKNSP